MKVINNIQNDEMMKWWKENGIFNWEIKLNNNVIIILCVMERMKEFQHSWNRSYDAI